MKLKYGEQLGQTKEWEVQIKESFIEKTKKEQTNMYTVIRVYTGRSSDLYWTGFDGLYTGRVFQRKIPLEKDLEKK